MNFKKWLKEYLDALGSSQLEKVKKQGIKIGGNTILINNIPDETILHLYIAYENEKTTKKLVLATLIVAIGSIALSSLTIYLHFKTPLT